MKKLTCYWCSDDTHPAVIERVRVIYNENLADMKTKGLVLITSEQQMAWWAEQTASLYVYSPVERPWEIVAFSKLTDRGSFVTPLFAIAKDHWGKGYGTEIIEHYLRAAGKPLYGAQLVSNAAICHMNEKAGWRVLNEREGVQYLYHSGVTPYRLPDPSRQEEIYAEIIRYHEGGQ